MPVLEDEDEPMVFMFSVLESRVDEQPSSDPTLIAYVRFTSFHAVAASTRYGRLKSSLTSDALLLPGSLSSYRTHAALTGSKGWIAGLCRGRRCRFGIADGEASPVGTAEGVATAVPLRARACPERQMAAGKQSRRLR